MTPDPTDEEVEALARHLCDRDEIDPDEKTFIHGWSFVMRQTPSGVICIVSKRDEDYVFRPAWERYAATARNALTFKRQV